MICHTLNSVKSSSLISLHCLTSGPQCTALITHSQEMQFTNESPVDVPGVFVDMKYCLFKRTYVPCMSIHPP